MTLQQLCYHFGEAGVKQVLLRRRFGADIMKTTRRIKTALAVGAVFLLTAGNANHWIDFIAPASACAQDSSKSAKPPVRRQKTVPGDRADQDRPEGRTSISVDVDLVSLQVLVTDKKGNVVSGLRPENFTIYEDNVKQEIANFAPTEANITVVVLVEYSKIITYLLDEIWETISAFANTLRRDDWVAIVGYDMRPTILSDFSKDRRQIADALKMLSFPALNESNLYDAVIDTLDRTQEIDGKVAILLISTGLDTFSKHTYDDAMKKCREANASIYAISLGQYPRLRNEIDGAYSASTRMDLQIADSQLRYFAELTGGESYFPRFPSEYSGIFNDISRMLRSQYSIGYVSSNTKRDGKFRKIKVEVKTDLMENGKPLKLIVTTRKGYTAAKD